MFTKARGIIFDFDDTILATFESRAPCVIQAAADFGFTISMEDMRRVWGKPFQEMIYSLMPTVDYWTWYEYYRLVMARNQPKLNPGAREIAAYLKGLGLHIAVVSSSSKPLVKQDLEAVGLLSLMDSIWGHEDSVYHKPDPRVLAPILNSLAELSISKDDCVYIGDSMRDYLVARGNGILFFAVTTGHEKPEVFLESGLNEEYIFPTLSKLLEPRSRFIKSI